MLSRHLVKIALVFSLVILAGCDPEALVGKKVPQPLRDVLTFGPQSKKGSAKDPGAAAARASLRITSPLKNQVYPVGEKVVFAVEAKQKDGSSPPRGNLIWEIFKGKKKKRIKLGKGGRLTKKLKSGKYEAKLVFRVSKKKRKGKKVKWNVLVAKVPFRVDYTITGAVTTGHGAVPGVDLVLTDFEGEKEFGRTRSDRKGRFSILFPREESCRLTPGKAGFSFSPLYKTLKFDNANANVNFRGAKGSVTDIEITESPDSEKPILDLCPMQEVYLKLAFSADMKPTRMEVALVRLTESGERRLLLGEAIDSAEIPNLSDPNAPRFMKIEVPEMLLRSSTDASQRLTITFYDSEGNSFSAAAKEDVRLDVGKCVRQRMAEAVGLHEKGKFEKAVKVYDIGEDFRSKLADSTALAEEMEKIYFNRGLAHVSLALAEKPGSVKQTSFLQKAIADFVDVLKYHKRDADAHMFRAVARHLGKNYEDAVHSYSEALRAEPEKGKLYELRGLARLRIGYRRNLSQAIDDLTEAISKKPSDQALRKTRRDALMLDVKTDRKSDDTKVDFSGIALPDISKRLNLGDYIRK